MPVTILLIGSRIGVLSIGTESTSVTLASQENALDSDHLLQIEY